MYTKEFDIETKQQITVKFKCDKCNQSQVAKIAIPHGNIEAENWSDGHGQEDEIIICQQCKKSFMLVVQVDQYGINGELLINELDEDAEVEMVFSRARMGAYI
jgi:transcription elongation factor Elf1